MTNLLDRDVLASLAAASRTIADALEEALSRANASASTETPGTIEHSESSTFVTSAGVWDPIKDVPRITPKVKGTREEQDWCSLTYLGGLHAINKRLGRGANRDEICDYAIKAGYRDGRAVTAWSKGNGATVNDENKQRWVTAEGERAVRRYAARLGVRLPDDLLDD